MASFLVQLALCLYLLAPLPALAQTATVIKDPLSYPLSQYGLIIGISTVGGIVNWYARLRKGDLQTGGVSGFIGELTTSAFAGVLTFWLCEYFSLSPLLGAAAAGLAGHAGGRGIIWMEAISRRRIERLAGVTSPAPLGPL